MCQNGQALQALKTFLWNRKEMQQPCQKGSKETRDLTRCDTCRCKYSLAKNSSFRWDLKLFFGIKETIPMLREKKSIEKLPELKRSGSHPVLQPSPKHLRTISTLRLYSDHEIPSQGRLGKGHRTGKWKEKMKVSHGQLQPTGKQSLCEISLWNLSIITCFTTSYY